MAKNLIDLVEWKDMSPSLFAWKYPDHNLSMGTQLIVHESQEAVFFSKGEIAGEFGPGRHTLSTENLPVVSKLFGIPFGGKNPFTADVWFVNKRAPLDIDWKISKIIVSDPQFKYVPLVASGRYGLRVENSSRFLTELVGTVSTFDKKQITDHFSAMIEQYTKNAIVDYMRGNNVPVTEIGANLTEIANAVRAQMEPFWQRYGLALPGFYVTNVDIDESEQIGRKIIEAIASSSAQSIAGYTWQQQQAMDIAKNAVSGPGGDMGILGMAMLTGAFSGGGGGFANHMMQPPQQPGMMGQVPPAAPAMGQGAARPMRQFVFCSNCGKKYPTTSKFCPNCGDKYNPCPVCGADNMANAKRCVSCGTALVNSQDMSAQAGFSCPSCGTPVSPGTKFCPNCGTKLS